MRPGGLSHLLPTHFPGNLPSPPNIIAFNTHPSDTALVNSLEGVVKERCLFLPFISAPYPMRIYIPREPLGKKLATGLFGRISRQSYVPSLSCPHTWWLLQRPNRASSKRTTWKVERERDGESIHSVSVNIWFLQLEVDQMTMKRTAYSPRRRMLD